MRVSGCAVKKLWVGREWVRGGGESSVRVREVGRPRLGGAVRALVGALALLWGSWWIFGGFRPVEGCEGGRRGEVDPASSRSGTDGSVGDVSQHWSNRRGRVYRSSKSSSSGRAVFWAISIAFSICRFLSSVMCTSGGLLAGSSVNWRLGSPQSLRAIHRKGFSKL